MRFLAIGTLSAALAACGSGCGGSSGPVGAAAPPPLVAAESERLVMLKLTNMT